jgi:membrane-associated phospholipid phosphatase
VAGALFVFGEFFGFNPVWWLCVVFFLAGLLGTSRMILRQHSLLQVVAGFVVGLVCSAIGLVYL